MHRRNTDFSAPLVTTEHHKMSSSLEVQGLQNKSFGDRNYGEEAQGLVEAQVPANQQQQKPKYEDDEGILPVILEDYLERAGVM